LAGVAGGNLLRVMKAMEDVGAELRKNGATPAYEIYEKREDIPRP
jgi:membrane dipeptidase